MLLLCDQSVLVLSLTDGNISDRVVAWCSAWTFANRIELHILFDRCSWGPLCHSHAIAPHATLRWCSMQALQFTFGVILLSLHFVGVGSLFQSLDSPNFDVFPWFFFRSKAMKSHTKQTHQTNLPNFSFRRRRSFVRCVRRTMKVM